MKLSELKAKLWGPDAETGVIWGFIAGIIFLGFFGHVDPAVPVDYAAGRVPYSIFWAWMSPFYWQAQPYLMILMVQSLAIYAFEWWLVKKGKIPKWLFILNLGVNTLWMAWSTPQYVLQGIFSPLAAMNPVVFPLELILKFPIGWSYPWDLANGHVQCGIFGHCADANLVNNRFIGLDPSNWGHYFQMAMWVIPVIVWIQNRRLKNRMNQKKCPGCNRTFKSLGLTDSSNICFDCREPN